MPISTAYEEADIDIVQVTPPTPDQPLPTSRKTEKGNHSAPIKVEIDEKPDIQAMDEKRQAILEERQRQIDMATNTVRHYREKIQDGVRPYADKTRDFAERQPVIFTFIAIFTALSIIPIACFTGFLVSATVFILGVAAVGICLSMLSCILIGSAILIPVLCFTIIVSLFLVTALVSLFLFYRLILHVRANVDKPSGEVTVNAEAIMTGVRGWLVECENRAGFPPLPQALSPKSEKIPLAPESDSAADEKPERYDGFNKTVEGKMEIKDEKPFLESFRDQALGKVEI